jgi:hypothetical protein
MTPTPTPSSACADEVFVTEHVLLEVWHGKRVSAATQFGVDWDGPTATVVHAAVFEPPNDLGCDGDVDARIAALEEEVAGRLEACARVCVASRVAGLSNRDRVAMALALSSLLRWYPLALVCVGVWACWWWRS